MEIGFILFYFKATGRLAEELLNMFIITNGEAPTTYLIVEINTKIL